MTALELTFLAALLFALSGIPALSTRIHLFPGRKIACGLIAAGSVAGLTSAGTVLLRSGNSETVEMAWRLPLGEMTFRLDPLSAFFLIPVLVITFCISLYACGYCTTSPENRAESLLTTYLGLISSAIIMLLLSASGITLLIFWEAMTLLVFLAMCLEHGRPEVRETGIHYLIASHVSTLALFVLFSLISHGEVFAFPGVGSLDPSGSAALGILLTALIGFGLKAGIMPLHIWLPSAHANAPSHISAVMSGIVIKMGIYGLIRVISFYSAPPLWWGVLFLILGIVSAVVGVLFAIGQHDLKRLLAYHSIENIGIILLGLGLGTLGKSTGHPVIQVLGYAGALLHVLNHSLFKGLLFLAAGSIVAAMGTRDLERMGGLGRRMPWTAAAFLAGSWAICGLPPLNGFVSEWFIYLGSFRALGYFRWPWSLAILAALAIIGALTLACFAKAYGTVFQGLPRTPEAGATLEAPHSMLVPMGILAGACALIGLAPLLVAPALDRVVTALGDGAGLQPVALLGNLTRLSLLSLLLLGLALLLWRWLRPLEPAVDLPTWDCGFAAATPRMQYSASSFADGLMGGLRWVLWPRAQGGKVAGAFPVDRPFASHVPDPVLDRVADPSFRFLALGATLLRFFQGGQLHIYLLYVLLTLLLLLLWMVV